MMSSTKAEHIYLTRSIEIYENERLWIGRGFSKMGLLPTERGPYSTKDGSLSWKTMPEACLSLLRGDFVRAKNNNNNNSSNSNGNNSKGASISKSKKVQRRGWSFHEEDKEQTNDVDDSEKENLRKEDEYECSTENGEKSENDYCGFVPCIGPEDGPTDGEDGWQYFPDFSPPSLYSPSRKRGMLDFVRRRKLRRVAFFRPDHFLPQDVLRKCDYCDSSVVNMLSSAMLDALALATLFAHGAKKGLTLTDAQALPLKSKLINTISIGHYCNNDFQSEDYDPSVDIYKIKDRLCSFAETCVGKPGPLMHLFNPDVDQNLVSAMPNRRKVMERYFNEKERVNLARLLIKDVDRFSYKMHCRIESCTCAMKATKGNSDHDGGGEDDAHSCEFRLVLCPNENCSAEFSYKHRTEHDDECGYKPLPCPSGCGAIIPRNKVHFHVRDKCSLRQAECPLAMFGCTAIVQAQDFSCHLNDHADKHFMLMANRMVEYQNVMKGMNARILALEEKNGQLERQLTLTAGQLQSKNDAKTVSNGMKKLTKRVGALESKCQTEFKKVEKDRRNQKRVEGKL